MHSTRSLLPLLLMIALGAAARAQAELVIATENPKQYHRASCPLLRERSQVTAMNRGQAEARGYKPHPACDPSNPAAQPVAGDAREPPQPPVYVYTAEGDTRYHRETCARLPKDRKKVLLEEAGKKLWPCSVCRPPVRKRSPAIPK